MFADDLCCLCPSSKGLRALIEVCEQYALDHDITYNCKKTLGMVFPTRTLTVHLQPKILVAGSVIQFSFKSNTWEFGLIKIYVMMMTYIDKLDRYTVLEMFSD